MKSLEFQMLLLYIIMILMITSAISDDFFINCGLPKKAVVRSVDGRHQWSSDDDPTFTPLNFNAVSTTAAAPATPSDDEAPYSTARIFNSTLTYSFPIVSPSPKFLRLYFSYNTTYNHIPPSQFSLSLEANNLTLLRNFSPYLNSQTPIPSCSSQSSNLMYEFHLVLLNTTKTLNLTFSPGTCSIGGCCLGFINGIEIVSAPDGLYINYSKPYSDVDDPSTGYDIQYKSAFQTAYRLNVGGSDVQASEDASPMGRTWYADDDCVVGFLGDTVYKTSYDWVGIKFSEIPDYTAPKMVYGTQRFIGLREPEQRERTNLTWGFKVDVGFDYLVRLHFCEMDRRVTGSGQRAFYLYFNGNRVSEEVIDVWELGGERIGSPIYLDYIFHAYGQEYSDASNGIKIPLFISLLPFNGSRFEDVLLNGLEILKLNNVEGNLAVPNPPIPPISEKQNPSSESNSKSSFYAIIGGVLGGLAVLFLSTLACLLIKRRSSKNKASTTTASNHSISSLPSHLCRRFSLPQITTATSTFDEAAIIGTGGFGKVYKGSMDIDGSGRATFVAIKRLNPTSKQGAYEFRTEIEMLSRLRHLHLVSLIGYCEEQDEMILVYEYMPCGSLRDHLITHKTLSWKQRLVICVGAARGLHYLHTSAKQPIIHRDVKSSNILLDEKLTAKVSDFGLSKEGPASEMGISHVSTAVKGSFGYLDPEYFRLQQLTEKSDVYSFGVLLFEVLCARAVVMPHLPKEQVNLALWGRNHYKSGNLEYIVDTNLKGQIASECLSKFGEIAEMCVRERRNERPSMGDVVGALEFALELQETADKNDGNGGLLGGFVGFVPKDNIKMCTIDKDEVTTSGENLSLSGSITTTTTTSNSEEHARRYLR